MNLRQSPVRLWLLMRLDATTVLEPFSMVPRLHMTAGKLAVTRTEPRADLLGPSKALKRACAGPMVPP